MRYESDMTELFFVPSQKQSFIILRQMSSVTVKSLSLTNTIRVLFLPGECYGLEHISV
jgi:hypothetical protein